MAKLTAAQAKRIRWWQEARFGMFIHWGLYSAGRLDCWMMHDMGVPAAEYAARLEPNFTGARFDADALMGRAKAAGFRYVVMGSRHHEGYCLWNTDTTDFSSAKGPPRRDFIAEYVRAARRRGLKVGFYYSLLDWRWPAYWLGPRKDPAGWAALVDYVHRQVRELMTRYGKIDILWYDGAWPASRTHWGFWPDIQPYFVSKELAAYWRAPQLNAMVRRLQPGILINNRTWRLEDFATPETTLIPEDRPWELCDNMGDLWGYAPADRNHRTPRQLLTTLITCVAGGGNFLLNVGPRPDGTLPAWQCRNLDRIGQWLRRNGEAIYGCTAEPQPPFFSGLAPWKTTRKDSRLYMHLLRYPGRRFGIANLHDYRLASAELLATGRKLKIAHEPTRDIISGLPAAAPDDIATVVKVTVRSKTAAERRGKKLIAFAHNTPCRPEPS